jgi:hypothetical protein
VSALDSLSTAREGRRVNAASVVAAIAVFAAGLFAYGVFYRLQAIPFWQWQLISNIEMTTASGRISLKPFWGVETWHQGSINSRAQEAAYNTAMSTLALATGLDAFQTVHLPLGIGMYLAGVLSFLESLRRAFRFSAVHARVLATVCLLVSAYYSYFIWGLYESAVGWFLLLLSWGTLFRLKCTPVPSSAGMTYAVVWLALVVVMNYIYPTVMIVNVLFLVTMVIYLRLGEFATSMRAIGGPVVFAGTGGYSNFACVALLLFYVHPFFLNLVRGVPSALSPENGLAVLADFFGRSDRVSSEYVLGLASVTHLALIIQLVLLGTAYAFGRFRSWRVAPGETALPGWLFCDAILIAATVIPFLAAAWGIRRTTEAFLMLNAVAIAAVVSGIEWRWTKGLLSLLILVAGLSASVTFFTDPLGVKETFIHGGERTGAAWAARHLNVRYFADLKLSNVALIENPRTLVESPRVEVTDVSDVAPFYLGEDAFAEALLKQGYEAAVLRSSNFDKALILVEYPVRPLPRYDLGSSQRFHTLYDNGDVQVYRVLRNRGDTSSSVLRNYKGGYRGDHRQWAPDRSDNHR